MAKQTIVTLTSDLSGKEVGEGGGTVVFTWDGRSLEIDLTAQERAAFEKAVEKYVSAARRVGAPLSRTQVGASAGRHSKETLAQVREWARKNGFEVPDRGRIPRDVREAYDAAHSATVTRRRS